MQELVCNLWDEPADAKCITTNGYIKTNGNLVMGAGVAGQAQERFPTFPKIAGQAVKVYGNIVHAFRIQETQLGHTLHLVNPNTTLNGKLADQKEWLITFPVKHVWYENADLDLIKRSATQLMELLNEPAFVPIFKKVLLPKPGCGNGQLTWDQVKPVIEDILDDRVYVIDNSLESMLGAHEAENTD